MLSGRSVALWFNDPRKSVTALSGQLRDGESRLSRIPQISPRKLCSSNVIASSPPKCRHSSKLQGSKYSSIKMLETGCSRLNRTSEVCIKEHPAEETKAVAYCIRESPRKGRLSNSSIDKRFFNEEDLSSQLHERPSTQYASQGVLERYNTPREEDISIPQTSPVVKPATVPQDPQRIRLCSHELSPSCRKKLSNPQCSLAVRLPSSTPTSYVQERAQLHLESSPVPLFQQPSPDHSDSTVEMQGQANNVLPHPTSEMQLQGQDYQSDQEDTNTDLGKSYAMHFHVSDEQGNQRIGEESKCHSPMHVIDSNIPPGDGHDQQHTLDSVATTETAGRSHASDGLACVEENNKNSVSGNAITGNQRPFQHYTWSGDGYLQMKTVDTQGKLIGPTPYDKQGLKDERHLTLLRQGQHLMDMEKQEIQQRHGLPYFRTDTSITSQVANHDTPVVAPSERKRWNEHNAGALPAQSHSTQLFDRERLNQCHRSFIHPALLHIGARNAAAPILPPAAIASPGCQNQLPSPALSNGHFYVPSSDVQQLRSSVTQQLTPDLHPLHPLFIRGCKSNTAFHVGPNNALCATMGATPLMGASPVHLRSQQLCGQPFMIKQTLQVNHRQEAQSPQISRHPQVIPEHTPVYRGMAPACRVKLGVQQPVRLLTN